MDIPRFDTTGWTVDAFTEAAAELGGDSLSNPYPTYVAEAIETVATADLSNARHVGWQSLLFAGDEPIAAIECTADAKGALVHVCTIRETLPRRIVAALNVAEDHAMANEETPFALVSIPQAGLTLVWLPASDMVIELESEAAEPRRPAELADVIRSVLNSE